MRLHGLLIAMLIVLSYVAMQTAYASRDEAICWSNPDPETMCGLLTKPFSAILAPFDAIAPGYGLLFIWAPLVFGLWFTTKSPAIAGIFGIILVGVDVSIGDILLNPTAIGMGIMLVAVSAGIGLIQIFQRIKQTV